MRFTQPKTISPFYKSDIKIPRKLKKKVKKYCCIHYQGMTNGQRLWHYMGKSNNKYKDFLITKVCENYWKTIK